MLNPAAARADVASMATRLYDVRHVNGDTFEIEADYFQREGGDWVFYVAQDEVYRVAFLDVLGVSKTPAWVHEQPSVHERPSAPEVWL